MANRPIFIVGPMGTGTTLLRLMLDSHPHIAIPPETGFMRAYNAHQFIPFKWTGRNWAKRMGWSREELDAELADFYDRIFMRYAREHGKERWGEKTPLHTWHVDDMARIYPDAQFIVMMRHPGGSVSSNMRRWEMHFGKAAGHYKRYAREAIRQAAAHADRFVLLRYEELVLQPEALMRELLDWLDEPWSDEVLEHHEVQSARGGKEMVEGRNLVADPIDVARVAKWQTQLDAEERQRLKYRLGKLGKVVGYDIDDATALEPLNDRGALLATGHDIDERIEAFPEQDLRTQGQVPRFDQLYHPRHFTLEPIPEGTDPKERRRQPNQPAPPAPPPPRSLASRALRRIRG
jgi:Sulfotransferase family